MNFEDTAKQMADRILSAAQGVFRGEMPPGCDFDLGMAALRKTGKVSPLYVCRKLLNAKEFISWAKSQGFSSTLTEGDLHVTIIYSKTPVDWFGFDSYDFGSELIVPAGGPRVVEALGDDGAVVLRFDHYGLQERHKCMVEAGASHSYDSYKPHVTITYNGEGVDLSKVEPFIGELRFGPEIFKEIVPHEEREIVEKDDSDEIYLAEIEKAEKSFSPPESVRSNAKRGLELRDKHNRGGTATGIARARDLSNGKSMPLSTIRRMNRFFIRHEKNKDTPPEEGNGKIAWLLWGGDAGARWARGIVNREVKKMIETVHSLNLMKSQYPNLDEAKDWVRRNGFSCDTHAELADSWVFLQKDIGGPVEEKILDTGVCVNIQKSEGVEKDVPFAKVDKQKQMVEGIVYEPWIVDAHGDWMHPEDIEKAAHDFMRNGRQSNIDREHDEMPVGDAEVVESFIAPADHPYYPEGSWVAKTHIRNPRIWKSVLDGEFNGYSMGGAATRIRGESPPMNKNFESFYKHESEQESIAKGIFQEDDDEEMVGARKAHRLKNVNVHYLSLVNKGANGKDFRFRKSQDANHVVLFKSRSLQLIDGDRPLYNDGPLTKITRFLKGFLGISKDDRINEPGPLDVPETGRMDPVQKNAGFLSLMAGMAHIAQRAATAEKVLVALAKSKQLSPAVQADPTLQGVLAEITKMGSEIDLQKFAEGMAGFMEQQGNNGMNLPGTQNFSGHVQQFFDNPGRFMQGFPDTVEAPGSFGGNSGQALSKAEQLKALAKKAGIDVDDLRIEETTQVEKSDEVEGNETDDTFDNMLKAMPAHLREKLSEEDKKKMKKAGKYSDEEDMKKMPSGKKDKEHEGDKMAKAIADAVAAAMAPLKAEISTLAKAQNPPAPESAPSNGLSQDNDDGASLVDFTDDEDLREEVQKSIQSGVISSKNPFGGAGDMLGIRGVGGGNSSLFSTSRQRGNG